MSYFEYMMDRDGTVHHYTEKQAVAQEKSLNSIIDQMQIRKPESEAMAGFLFIVLLAVILSIGILLSQ